MTARRGALFGIGGIARLAHLPAFRSGPDVESRLQIVVAVDPPFAGTEIDGVPVVAHPWELARFGRLDFVDVCTPTATHHQLVLWALSQGYHVLCEKPVALNRVDAARISAAAAAAGRVVTPCHQHRHNPAWLQLRQWLDEGFLGRWHLAEYQVYRPAADLGAQTGGIPWRGVARTSMGGVLLDHGTHLLYQLMDIAGVPASVQAWTGRLGHPEYDVEDTAQVVCQFADDRAANLFLTWAGRERENRIRFFGEKGLAEWRGGTLRLDSEATKVTLDFSAQLNKASYAGWFGALLLEFAEAMEQDRPGPMLEDLSRVAWVLEAAYASARDGHRVVVA